MASPEPFAWLLVCSTNGVPIMSFRHNVPLDSPSVSLSTQGLISSLYTAASEAGMVLRGMTTMPVSKVDGNATGRHSSCINSRDATANDVDPDRVKFRHALAWKRFDASASTSGAAGARGSAADQHDGCIMAFLTDAMQHTQPSRATSHSTQYNLVELERCLSFLHSLFVAWLGPVTWASLCRNPNQRQVRLSLAPLAPVIDSMLSFRPMLTCGGWSEPHSLVFSNSKQTLLTSFVNGLCVGTRATHAFLLAGAVCTVASTQNGIGAIDQGALNVLYHTACLVDTTKASESAQTPTAVRQCVLHLPVAQAVVPFHVAAVPLSLRIQSSGAERSATLIADIAVGVVDSPWRLLLLRPCQLLPAPRQQRIQGDCSAQGAVGAASSVADDPVKSQLYGNQWHVSQLLEDLARCLHTFACRCCKDAHAQGGAQATANSDSGTSEANAVDATAGIAGTTNATTAATTTTAPSPPRPEHEAGQTQEEQTVGSIEQSAAPVKLRARHSLLPTLLACMAQAENRAKAVHKSRDLCAYWPAVQGELLAEGPSDRRDNPSHAERTATVTSFAAAHSGGIAKVIDALEHSTSSALHPTGMYSSSVSGNGNGEKLPSGNSKSIGRRARLVDTVLEPSELIQWALSMAGGGSRADLYGDAQALPARSLASKAVTRQRLVLCKVTVTGAATSKAEVHAASLKARVYVLGRTELPSLLVTFGCHGGGPSCSAFPPGGQLYSGSPTRPPRTGNAEEKKASSFCSCTAGTTVLPYLGLDTGCVRALVGSMLASAQETARAALVGHEEAVAGKAVNQHTETPVCVQGPCVSIPSSPEAAQGGLVGPGEGEGDTGVQAGVRTGEEEAKGHRINTAQWSMDTQEYVQGRRVFSVASRVTDLQPTGESTAPGVSVTVDVTATVDLHSLRFVLDELAGMARRMPQRLPAPAEESQEGSAASVEWKALESEAVLDPGTAPASRPRPLPGTGTPSSPSPSHKRAKAPARSSTSKGKHREQTTPGPVSPGRVIEGFSPGVVAATRLRQSALRSPGDSSPGGAKASVLTPQQQGAFQRIREQQAALVAAARTGAVDATVPALSSAAAPVDAQAQAPPASASSVSLTSPAAIQKLQSLALSGSPGTQRALLSAFKKERVAKAEVRTEIEQVRARLRAQKAALQLEIEKAKLSQAQKALHASKGGPSQHPTRSASSTATSGAQAAENKVAPPTLPSPARAETILVIRREPSLYSLPRKEARAGDVALASPTRAGPAAPGGDLPQSQAREEAAGMYSTPSPQRKSFVLDVDTPAVVV